MKHDALDKQGSPLFPGDTVRHPELGDGKVLDARYFCTKVEFGATIGYIRPDKLLKVIVVKEEPDDKSD